MRLIGLVTFMPVNIQLASEGNDGWGVVTPFLRNPPVTCPMCLQGATCIDDSFLRDIFIPKHYIWKK